MYRLHRIYSFLRAHLIYINISQNFHLLLAKRTNKTFRKVIINAFNPKIRLQTLFMKVMSTIETNERWVVGSYQYTFCSMPWEFTCCVWWLFVWCWINGCGYWYIRRSYNRWVWCCGCCGNSYIRSRIHVLWNRKGVTVCWYCHRWKAEIIVISQVQIAISVVRRYGLWWSERIRHIIELLLKLLSKNLLLQILCRLLLLWLVGVVITDIIPIGGLLIFFARQAESIRTDFVWWYFKTQILSCYSLEPANWTCVMHI